MPAVVDAHPYASPQAQLRQRLLGELRWQLSQSPPFDVALAAARFNVDRDEILAVLGVLRALELVHFVADAGWQLTPIAAEVA